MELSELSSIKPRQIKLLQENGITDIKALSMSVPGDLEEIEGISAKASKKLIWDARDVMGMSTFKQVSTIEENYDFLTTGSKNFDEILNGGISTGRLTEVFGAFKSGKTNLAHTLAVTCQMPIDEGGLNGAVLYIDTENTFSKTKIERIARRFGIDPKKILKNIYHARIYSTDHQFQMIRAAEQACIEKNARLIIVDSLMALMRSEYVGIGMLAARQQVLNKMIHELSRIAETHNVAVLLTNQVATFMKGTFAANDAIGGNIVAHGCHFRIQFKTKGFSANTSLERTAIIVDAPDLAPEVATFFITEAGISDTEKVEYLLDENEPVKKSTSTKKKKTAKKTSKKKAIAVKSAELSDPLESL
ncbi:MAG: DNA repair and recombination protein RadA [Promethearchaeota archaeon]